MCQMSVREGRWSKEKCLFYASLVCYFLCSFHSSSDYNQIFYAWLDLWIKTFFEYLEITHTRKWWLLSYEQSAPMGHRWSSTASCTAQSTVAQAAAAVPFSIWKMIKRHHEAATTEEVWNVSLRFLSLLSSVTKKLIYEFMMNLFLLRASVEIRASPVYNL